MLKFRSLVVLAFLVAGLWFLVADTWAIRELQSYDAWIPTSDGKKLKVYVVLPPSGESGPWPTIFVYTSYGARRYRDAVVGQRAARIVDRMDGEDPLFGLRDPGDLPRVAGQADDLPLAQDHDDVAVHHEKRGIEPGLAEPAGEIGEPFDVRFVPHRRPGN